MKPDTSPPSVDLSAPAAPQLHAILRQRIIDCALPPGTRLSESDIAAKFSVSRQPVREAFIKLADEGLLDIRPQRGTFVRKISTAAVMDARFVREAIEADIVKLLAQDHDAALDADLRAQLVEQGKVAGQDPDRFIQLDEIFHRTLAQAAGLGGAWSMVEGLKIQMDRVRHLSLMQFPMSKLLEQHRAIADTIIARDPVAAEAALRNHLREILRDLPVIARDMPEFFSDRET